MRERDHPKNKICRGGISCNWRPKCNCSPIRIVNLDRKMPGKVQSSKAWPISLLWSLLLSTTATNKFKLKIISKNCSNFVINPRSMRLETATKIKLQKNIYFLSTKI